MLNLGGFGPIKEQDVARAKIELEAGFHLRRFGEKASSLAKREQHHPPGVPIDVRSEATTFKKKGGE